MYLPESCYLLTTWQRSQAVLSDGAASMSKKHQEASSSQQVKTKRFPNERLKAHRLKKNWTQVYVATRIGTSDVEVSRWETGAAKPTLYFRERVCELFGASPEALRFVSSPEAEQRETAQHPVQRHDSLSPPSPSGN